MSKAAKTSGRAFNPRLRAWLNERDYTSGDWPENVPPELLRAADADVGGGVMLDYLGWPIDQKRKSR